MPAFEKTTLEIIDLSQNNPLDLPPVFDGTSFAFSLGIKYKTLIYLITQRSKLYTVYSIPKKNGGVRQISAPSKVLKYVQKRFLDVYLNTLRYPEHVAAYVPKKTLRDTALKHAGKPIVIIMDLKDFFPSTRRAWIRNMIQDTWGYSHRVAGLMADLVTIPVPGLGHTAYVVPQGAPTSGAICNWVACHRLDPQILEICDRWGMTYTRYADDLEFSTVEKLSREQVNTFKLEILQAVFDSGYRANKKKTRVARAGRQQRLLGMTINEKPNVMRKQFRNLRAQIHNCKLRGFDTVAAERGLPSGEALKSKIVGMISYYHMVNPAKAAQLRNAYATIENSQGPVTNEILHLLSVHSP